MNSIRQIQALNKRELENAVPPEASWHADYRDTAYIYIGGLPYELSEGDIVTIFSQFGEPVHINLVRDKETGKSKGFAFLKYEDQRSTDLAVDNLCGATVMGRMLRVDHVRYKRREDEGEEDNVAPPVIGAEKRVTDGRGDDTDDEERRKRRKRRGSDDTDVEGKRRRPMLKEEKELAELMRDHDEEDPMKEFLIEEKKEEVARAIEKWKKSEKKRRRDDSRERSHRHRHHRHHHRRRSEDRSLSREDRSRRDRSPSRERRSHRDRSASREKRSHRDRSASRERSYRDRQDRNHQIEDDTGIEETATDDSLTIPIFSTIIPSLHLCTRMKQGGEAEKSPSISNQIQGHNRLLLAVFNITKAMAVQMCVRRQEIGAVGWHFLLPGLAFHLSVQMSSAILLTLQHASCPQQQAERNRSLTGQLSCPWDRLPR
ncbi:hypothetical protein VTN00DRAFT_6080 [Thermoascus crustaceus]|uniref:uncharacterized protein n=1 Tax=Thermoascus crustaceus TaxID=5088 RepID=UPI003742206A